MDEKLISAINDMAMGKEEGFNAVYSATYNHVYFRAKAYMKDETDAQDLTQIVYIEAYKNIKSLQNAESLFGWLDGICHNQGMKLFRKKKDVLTNVDEEGKDIFETLESNDLASLPELSTDQKETSRIIQEFIDELPEVQKAAVIAYYFDGFSVGEIAQMQNCSEGTVKSRLNYARKFLKEKVEGTEKRDGIRLHAVALPTIWYAIKLMSENTKLSAKAAGGIYAGSCAEVGLASTAITVGNAGAGISAKLATTGAGTIAATTSGAGAAAGTAGAIGATGAAVATGTGLSMEIKALIIAGAVLIGGGEGAGVTYVAVNNNHENEAEIVAEADESEIGNTLETKEGNDESEDNRDEMPITDEKEPDNSSLPGLQEQLVATGTVIRNYDVPEYREKREEYSKKYGNLGGMNEYGIRFTEPVKLLVDGDVVEIKEAWILPYISVEDVDLNEFVGKTITAEGGIGTHLNSKKISEDLYQYTEGYSYYPNGEYEFIFYKIIDSTENPEAKNEEEIALTDDEKIQIVDAIAYFDYGILPDKDYVIRARDYALAMHSRTSDGERAFPWSKTDKLSKELITDIWKAFGITIPSDYGFNDNGITPNSDYDDLYFTGDMDRVFFDYESLDVVNNGDGTYKLKGTYKRQIEDGPNESVPFTATAVKGGNPDIFGGLIIKDFSSSDSPNLNQSDAPSSINTELMAEKASEMMSNHQATGISYAYVDAYYFFDITSDNIPELLYVEGTCEADFVLYIYTWNSASSSWKYFGETPGDHIAYMWGKNTHDGFYLSSCHMGYAWVYEFNKDKKEANQIVEATEVYENENGYYDVKTIYNPTDAKELPYYDDISLNTIKAAIESSK